MEQLNHTFNNIDWHSFVYYAPDVPSGLRWKVKVSQKIKVDQEAGTAHCTKGTTVAWAVRFKGQKHYAHRVVWYLHHGPIHSGVIDHIDGNTSNNSISNLRLVSQGENCKNTGMKRTNTSGITGVAIVENPSGVKYWRASWMENGKFRS